jgi:hypothetical protein
MGVGKRNACKLLVRNPEGKEPFGKQREIG